MCSSIQRTVSKYLHKSIINSCLDACNLSANCMMSIASKRITPLVSPSKFKAYFENGCGEGCTCYPIVSTCDYHVTVPLHVVDDHAMLNIVLVAINGEIGFGRV